jgi:hypothetical protein
MGAKGHSIHKVGRLQRFGVGAVALFALLGLSACVPAGGGGGGGPAPITYQAFTSSGGTGFATYSVPGGTQQETVPSGWSLDVGYIDFAYISVQNDSDFGSVTCVLIRNGVIIVQNTSNGAYAIATCHDPF